MLEYRYPLQTYSRLTYHIVQNLDGGGNTDGLGSFGKILTDIVFRQPTFATQLILTDC